MKPWLRIIIALHWLLIIASLVFTGQIPDNDPSTSAFHESMMRRLDSLDDGWQLAQSGEPIRIGWSVESLTPSEPMPLAGYGARNPKTFEEVADSVYVRTLVLDDGNRHVAWLCADLLVVHPEVSRRFFASLPEGWDRSEIFFSATHSHSSFGAWAPGFVGKLFSGEYDERSVDFIVDRLVASLQSAEQQLRQGALSYNELQVPELVRNRLVKDRGIIDPWMKILGVKSGDLQGYVTVYSAHATSLSHRYRKLSGDFPGFFNEAVLRMPGIDFSMYAAGAVGSMAPVTPSEISEEVETQKYSQSLAQNIALLELLAPEYDSQMVVSSLRVPLELPDPMMKINRSHSLRSWLFKRLIGNYSQELAVAVMGDLVLVGVPCDFSGELAVPLYQYARELGLHLVITSFNGAYTGYVVKDDWYDEDLYESRVMSWYGPGMGAYYTEIISRVLDMIAKKQEP